MRTRLLAVLAAVALAAGCQPRPSPRGAASDSGRVEATAGDTGRFVAEYGEAAPDFAEFRSDLMAHRFLDTIAARLNDSLRIPKDIVLTTAHCDEPNASYEPETGRVTLCYELFKYLTERLAKKPGGEYLVTGTVMFALMHETGHALVDVLGLPITGREEDAVDQLATILLLQQGVAGDSLAFGAVGWFASSVHRGALDSLAFADDHGLEQQRVYNILCWIYGRDPDRYPEIVSDGWLPEHRAIRCAGEFRRLTESWRRLLAPYRRQP